jgi:flagellar assembly protein FliH
MSSILLSGGEAGISSLSWRNKNRSSSKPELPAYAALKVSSENVQQLRAQIAEITSSSEQIARNAHDSGYRAGELAARQALEAEMRACAEKLAQTIADLASTRDQTIRRAEEDTVRLALEIARRVLHRELSVDPSAIEALVKAALEKLRNQEVYRVRVHPDQEPLIRRCLQQMGRGQEVEIVSDAAQARGGALFEISRGALDASVETQLREIERGLVDEMEMRK